MWMTNYLANFLRKLSDASEPYDIDMKYKKRSEMYFTDTLRRHFGDGKDRPTRSECEEEIE